MACSKQMQREAIKSGTVRISPALHHKYCSIPLVGRNIPQRASNRATVYFICEEAASGSRVQHNLPQVTMLCLVMNTFYCMLCYCVLYRTIFPEHAFGDRCLEDLNLKILRDDSSCPGACQVIQWWVYTGYCVTVYVNVNWGVWNSRITLRICSPVWKIISC